jgi:hypothetical protein
LYPYVQFNSSQRPLTTRFNGFASKNVQQHLRLFFVPYLNHGRGLDDISPEVLPKVGQRKPLEAGDAQIGRQARIEQFSAATVVCLLQPAWLFSIKSRVAVTVW